MLVIDAKITGIVYTPLLCKSLTRYDADSFESALNKETAFLLDIRQNTVAISTWVSAKRTRSYPYARVYNTLRHSGKKITVIPFVKDEGKDGDRDFIQWDTISLMSLLDVYVIVAYYAQAEASTRYANKITRQQFDPAFVRGELERLLSYQSSALHWNIDQIGKIANIAQAAKLSYVAISRDTGIPLHSPEGIDKRIALLMKSKTAFMSLSRDSAKSAQRRETMTIQPKEQVTNGTKAQINITNYLGGIYYLTSDETRIKGNTVFIIEGKHTKQGKLPSDDDIKDGLLKMFLFANLKEVQIDGKPYTPVSILKLTAEHNGTPSAADLNSRQQRLIAALTEEAKINRFELEFPWSHTRE
ncbi:hypothetical protein [Treponema endosymbiont of Eucomonympha sp.]|uniref:hypothetical protein n=1 Tax=Treponema endosymbiont of Eucomonympha sp. TaxID=1580831 RepID=UPI000750F01C|nr:hypothetical protein [Treponema endosymbiont of Eucomonympha sp.]